LIEDSNGDYIEDVSQCDGSTQVVVDNLFCLVEMTALRADPFDRVLGELVQAKVIAINERGPSGASPENTDTNGAKIETAPDQMAVPTRGADTSHE